jgi:hypothetical protein
LGSILHQRHLLTARCHCPALPDLIVHFRLHSRFIPRETSPSFQANS